MRLIIKIAKKELLYLLFSPIAWFVTIVFIIQCGFLYFDVLSQWAYTQDMLTKNSPAFKGFNVSLTESIFIKGNFFQTVYQNLFLFVPLLTMGLISREVNTGSIKLLFSSPITARQLVFGKYLGIMGFISVLTAAMLLLLMSGITGIRNCDYGILLSGALAFYLLAAVYSSVGLFMSSITNNLVISGISVFAILFILSFIGGVWQQYDFVRDLTYFLSVNGRAEDLAKGLIISKDVIYFIVISALFIAFTVVKLRSHIHSWNWYQAGVRYLLVTSVALAIGYITSRPSLTLYADVSARQTNTIHPRTQQLIKQLGDGPMKVTLYINLFDRETLGYGLPQFRNAIYLKFWERYLRFKPTISFDYVYYYYKNPNDSVFNLMMANSEKSVQQIARETAESLGYDFNMFKSPESLPELISLKPDECRLMMKMEFKGRSQWLRLYKTPFPDDNFPPFDGNMYATLKHLTVDPPKMYFTSGHLERSIHKNGDREFRYLVWTQNGLASNGFVVDTLNLATQKIPDSCDILVVADPKIPFSSAEMQKLQNYMGAGRNLMIMGYPGKQTLLNPLLEATNMRLAPGQMVMPTNDETPDKVISYVPADVDGFAEELSAVKQYLQKGDTQLLLRPTPSTTAIIPLNDSISPVTITPMLKSLPQTAWIKATALVTDSTLPPMDPSAGDWKTESFVTATAVARQISGKEQRIIVTGGADLLSNKHINSDVRNTAATFFRWLNYGKNPVFLPRKKAEDTLLNITGPVAMTERIIYMWVLPATLLIAGTLLIIRRKRR